MNITITAEDLKNITSFEPAERDALKVLSSFENKLSEAAKEYSPAVIANFTFDLAKEYNKFYQSIPIFSEADQTKLKFRIAFSEVIADTIKKAMSLLGITVPDKM